MSGGGGDVGGVGAGAGGEGGGRGARELGEGSGGPLHGYEAWGEVALRRLKKRARDYKAMPRAPARRVRRGRPGVINGRRVAVLDTGTRCVRVTVRLCGWVATWKCKVS